MPQRRHNLYDPYALPRRFYNRRIRPNADQESEEDEHDHIHFKKRLPKEEYERRRKRAKALSEKDAKERRLVAESKAIGKKEAAKRLKEAKHQQKLKPHEPIQKKRNPDRPLQGRTFKSK